MRHLPLVVLLLACSPTPQPSPAPATDSAFASVQSRGESVMGVNQYTSRHVFQDLVDGGRIVLERGDPSDTVGIETIRAHMRSIVGDFRAGNFTKPFAVHAQVVPGTDVMTRLKDRIAYAAVDRPTGAEVRITTSDRTAVDAVHRFLAFQRMDHRAAGHEH